MLRSTAGRQSRAAADHSKDTRRISHFDQFYILLSREESSQFGHSSVALNVGQNSNLAEDQSNSIELSASGQRNTEPKARASVHATR